MSRMMDDGGDELVPLQDDDSTTSDQQPPKKKRRKSDLILLLVALLFLIGALVSAGIALRQNQDVKNETHGLVDISGNPIIPDDPDMFDPSVSAAADQVDQITPSPDSSGAGGGGGLRFQVPSLNMNVPLGAINAVNDSLNPANYTNAFWVRNLGVSYDDPSSGTVYVVMHSARTPGYGPGNYFFNEDKQIIYLNPGDQIVVAGHTYAFQKWTSVNKPDLPGDTDLWTPTPGRLVIITCLQNPQHTESEVNLVIYAQLVS